MSAVGSQPSTSASARIPVALRNKQAILINGCRDKVLQHLKNKQWNSNSYVPNWLKKFEDHRKRACESPKAKRIEAVSMMLSLMKEAVMGNSLNQSDLDIFQAADLYKKVHFIDHVIAKVKKWYMS
jgi:hypothetical protein